MSTSPDAGDSDVHLVERIGASDRAAFGLLMRRHSSAVLRFAWALSDDRTQAEDAGQETFLQLWKQRRSLTLTPGSTSVLPWLLTTCRYVTYGTNRRGRRIRTEPLAPAHENLPDQSSGAGSEDLRFVLDEMAKLSDVDWRLCQLCLIEGRTYAEAEAALGLPVTALRKRLQRNRAKLSAARSQSN